MSKIIEVIVASNGETRVETKGFAGSECREASRFIEDALGKCVSEIRTPEFHTISDETKLRNSQVRASRCSARFTGRQHAPVPNGPAGRSALGHAAVVPPPDIRFWQTERQLRRLRPVRGNPRKLPSTGIAGGRTNPRNANQA